MAQLVDIVSSRVKAELFRLLFGIAGRELHLRELVRQSGLSLGTVQQEVSRLTQIGLLTSRKDGNRVAYRANPDHPLFPELRSLVLKTDGLAGALQPALEIPGVHLAFVFGSMARAEANAASDVDLMVIGSVGLRRLSGALSGLSERIGREINPHVFTAQEFLERKARGDHFITSVLAAPRLFVKGTEHELAAMGK